MSAVLRIRISARAAAQIHKAAAWWQLNRPAAPGAVRIDVDETLRLLSMQPGIGAPFPAKRSTDVRRVLVSRIRNFIYYRVTSGNVDVLAFWHASRGSGPSL